MTKVKSITNVNIHNDDEAPVEDLIACSEDKLDWINLTDLANEKYPDPKEKWIKIKQESFDFILFCLEEAYDKDELAIEAEDPCYKLQLFDVIKELKSQQK